MKITLRFLHENGIGHKERLRFIKAFGNEVTLTHETVGKFSKTISLWWLCRVLRDKTPECVRWAAINRNHDNIKYFLNTATDEMKFLAQSYAIAEVNEERLAAVRKNGKSIRYFADTATDEMKLAAVRQHGHAIKYFINTATEEQKIAALRQNGDAIKYFLG